MENFPRRPDHWLLYVRCSSKRTTCTGSQAHLSLKVRSTAFYGFYDRSGGRQLGAYTPASERAVPSLGLGKCFPLANKHCHYNGGNPL